MAILNLGSMNLDHVYTVSHFVRPGESLQTEELRNYFGGKGMNQSIAAARSGAAVFHAGMLGRGGEQIAAWLEACGADCSLLGRCDAPQGHTVIQVDPHGQNSILICGGSNQCITRSYIDQVLDQFHPGDYLMLQNEISELAYAVEAGCRRGLHVVLNASPLGGALNEIDLSRLSWLLVNELECAGLAGISDPFAAFDHLRAALPNTGILLTLGAEGSVAAWRGELHREPARRTTPVDTTGAGDTYTGYFIGSLSAGKPLAEAMRIASAAAAISISLPGASASIPDMEMVLRALQTQEA